MLELSPSLLIGHGTSRACYRHPHDPDLCVKVLINKRKMHHLTDELAAWVQLAEPMHGFIATYQPGLVATNHGPGLVCQMIRDADGLPSPSLYEYRVTRPPQPELMEAINRFFRDVILRQHLRFYDFNARNFIVQTTEDGLRLYFIDLKGYNKYKPLTLLGLERICRPLAMGIVRRRAARLYEHYLRTDIPDFLGNKTIIKNGAAKKT